MSFECGERPRARESSWPLLAGKGQETDFPSEPPQGTSPGNILGLAP